MKSKRIHIALPVLVWIILFAAGSWLDGGSGLTGLKGPAMGEVPPGEKIKVLTKEVRFMDGDTALAGTLYQPDVKNKVPALAVLAGSDRSRRGPLRKRLGVLLASRGISVLVYDSPGTGRSTGNAMIQTKEGRVREALAAVRFLQNFPGIKENSVGLLGGSEGADIALMASADSEEVAFCIAVSGSSGIPVLDILRYSAEEKGRRSGLSLDEIMRAVAFKEIAYKMLSGAGKRTQPSLARRVRYWKDPFWDQLIDLWRRDWRSLNSQEKEEWLSVFRGIISEFSGRSWYPAADEGRVMGRLSALDADSFFGIVSSRRLKKDPAGNAGFISGIQCPVLAIWGGKDSFVPPRRGAEILRKALGGSGTGDYRIKIFARASHYLTTGLPSSPFIDGYPDLVATWILDRF